MACPPRSAARWAAARITHLVVSWSRRSAPDRQVEPPAPPLRPALRPEWPADHDADRAPEARRQGEEQSEAVDAERADRVADRVAKEGVLMLGGLDLFALHRIGRGQYQTAMHGQSESRREEERHGQHVRWIVVKVKILVSSVGYPIEVAENAVWKTIAPCAHQERADDDQGEIREDRHAERRRHVVADAELAADLDLAQPPRHERAQRTHRDDLPETAILKGSELQAVADVGRCDVDLPDVPGRPDRRAVDHQQGAEHREEHPDDAEEADEERPDPEVEQVAAQQRAAADPVLSLEAQHRHGGCSSVRPEKG